MDSRYTDPEVTNLWSPASIAAQWLAIETTTLRHQIAYDIVPEDEGKPLLIRLEDGSIRPDQATSAIAGIEARTQHDVAAFLEWVRSNVKPEAARWLHYGLTSSDVVDTAQGMRFRDMRMHMLSTTGNLVSELNRWCMDDTPILGRTHGQIAEIMTMRARAWHWLTTIATPAADLSRHTGRVAVCKLSGPVGTYAHNGPKLEQVVAQTLGLRPHGPGASQIASRSALAAWANSAALLVGACAKIAMDIRLMDLLGETTKSLAVGQVGSSSMAHKRNPVRAEQIGGMARLARGYASMLQPLDVWLERDMSHSSVERVAVPDLWHVTLHTVRQTTELLKGLTLDEWRINDGIEKAGGDPLVCERTLQLISEGMGWDEARKEALSWSEWSVIVEPANGVRLMANYPAPGGIVSELNHTKEA